MIGENCSAAYLFQVVSGILIHSLLSAEDLWKPVGLLLKSFPPSSTRPHFIEDQKGLITSRLSISPPNSEIIHHNNGILAAVLGRVGSLELLLLSPAHRGMHSSASQSRNFPKSSQNGQLQY